MSDAASDEIMDEINKVCDREQQAWDELFARHHAEMERISKWQEEHQQLHERSIGLLDKKRELI